MRLSVITPVGPKAKRSHLRAAAESLLAQDADLRERGIDWEWLVQIDHKRDRISSVLPADPRISCEASGVQQGAAGTRNFALVRSTGSIVKNLDADDLLPAGSLAATVDAFREHPEVGFVVGPAVDLKPNGDMQPAKQNPPAGLIGRGTLLDHFEHHPLPLVHPATLAARRHLVFEAALSVRVE